MNDSPHFLDIDFPKEQEAKEEFLGKYFDKYFKAPEDSQNDRLPPQQEARMLSNFSSSNSPQINSSLEASILSD